MIAKHMSIITPPGRRFNPSHPNPIRLRWCFYCSDKGEESNWVHSLLPNGGGGSHCWLRSWGWRSTYPIKGEKEKTWDNSWLARVKNIIIPKFLTFHFDFQVEEKVQAEAEYERGLQQQKTSILLTEESPDIFQIKLGHLPPGAGARVSCLSNYVQTEERKSSPNTPFSTFWKKMRIFWIYAKAPQ